MKHKRMTEKAIGCFGYDLKDFEHKPKEIFEELTSIMADKIDELVKEVCGE